MSKVKGAPPPGWRPTVKGKSGFSGQGDVLTNAAQGGSISLPDGGAAIAGSRFSASGGMQSAQKGAQAESDLRELFAGDVPDYGLYRAVPSAMGGYPQQGAQSSAAPPVARSAKKPAHERFFEDDAAADAKAPAPAPRSRGGGFDALFEGLDDGNDSKAKAGGASAKPAVKPALPSHYPTGHNEPDYRGLFERLQNGGVAPVAKDARGGSQEEAALFKQRAAVEEPPAAPQPSLPRATMGGGKSIRRGQKLVLDLDSFLVDCAVDWGKDRMLKSFNFGGKADEGVVKWSEAVQSRGVLTIDDFRNHGVELDLSDSVVIASSHQQLEKFAGALKMDRAITTLRLSRAQLGDSGCSWLAGGMMKNKTLKELILSENDLTDSGIDGLAAVLDTNMTLTSLDLSSNSVTSTGASLLADGLKRNRKLRELNLSFNAVDDAGAESLAEAVDPASTSTSVLRNLNLEGNPVGASGCSKLLESFHKKGTFLETLSLPEESHSTKTASDTKRKEPESFIVVCSETGVDIRAAGRRVEQVTWVQEAEDIEITFKDHSTSTWSSSRGAWRSRLSSRSKTRQPRMKETWIQKTDMKALSVDFSEQHLRIELKGAALMDAQLFGRIRPRESSWTMGNGILQVILAKADKSQWASLTASL